MYVHTYIHMLSQQMCFAASQSAADVNRQLAANRSKPARRLSPGELAGLCLSICSLFRIGPEGWNEPAPSRLFSSSFLFLSLWPPSMSEAYWRSAAWFALYLRICSIASVYPPFFSTSLLRKSPGLMCEGSAVECQRQTSHSTVTAWLQLCRVLYRRTEHPVPAVFRYICIYTWVAWFVRLHHREADAPLPSPPHPPGRSDLQAPTAVPAPARASKS